tara:strand:- start:10 stop:507 length:498 start_codon:yes stop_codon:yes gene_type:complete
MFKEDNLVRLITEDGTSEVMRVINDSDEDGGVTYVATNRDNGTDWITTSDLELVTDSTLEQESVIKVPNINSIKGLELVDEFNKYIIGILTSLRNDGFDERITITIECEHYSGESAEVKYQVRLRHDDPITSDNLDKSAHIALSRRKENETLKVKAIPFYVEATK